MRRRRLTSSTAEWCPARNKREVFRCQAATSHFGAVLWRLQFCLLSALLLSQHGILPARVAAEGQACSVASTSQFTEALQNDACDVVLIAGAGLTLLESEFDQAVTVGCTTCAGGAESGKVFVRDGRSVVVRGERPDVGTMLDPAWLKRRILLGANVTFQVENLFVPNCRQPSATSAASLDIIYMSPDSTVVLKDVVLHYTLCAPLDLTARFAPAVARPEVLPPADVPGSDMAQVVRFINTTFCVPDTVPFAPTCWTGGLQMVDYGIAGTRLDSQGVRLTTGAVHNLNTVFVCQYVVASACMAAKGLPTCVAETVTNRSLSVYDLYDLPIGRPGGTDEAGDGGGGGGGGGGGRGAGSSNTLKIVLPAVLGGVAVVALLVGAAVLLWRRSRSQQATLAAVHIMHASRSSGTQDPLAGLAGGPHGSPGVGQDAACCLGGQHRMPSARSTPDGALMGRGLGLVVKEGAELGNVKVELDSPKGRGPGAPGGPARTPAALTLGLLKPQNSGGRDGAVGSGAAALLGAAPHKFPPSFHTTTCSTAGGGAEDAGGTLVVSGLVTGTTDASVETHGSTSGGQALQGSSGYGHLGTGAAAATEGVLGNPLLASGAQPHLINIPLNLVLGQDLIVDRENVIGRGTFATVVHGVLPGGREVAVKLFHRDALGGTAEDVKGLKQEVAILARCQHPNVVALLGAGSTVGGDEVFLVEELMATNLARACHEGPGLPLPRVLAVARDVAAGLAYLHPTVIHRDLKPANVLLDSHGAAKLTDFGLSRLWASTVHTANPEAGTVQYMAPECFSSSLSMDAPERAPITHHCDIYSFGVLLWEMLARERPWRGLGSIQVALAVGYEGQQLKLPEEDTERFPAKLKKLILQCWDKDPRKRPGATEVAKRLSLMLQQLETHGSLSSTAMTEAGAMPVPGLLAPLSTSQGASSEPCPASASNTERNSATVESARAGDSRVT